jgi:hypothetical protein
VLQKSIFWSTYFFHRSQQIFLIPENLCVGMDMVYMLSFSKLFDNWNTLLILVGARSPGDVLNYRSAALLLIFMLVPSLLSF